VSLTQRVVALSTTFLPLEQARQALLPPVHIARVGAVAVARTVRHWELVLGGEDPDAETTAASAESSERVTRDTRDELPVDDWAELSYADAQAKLAACDADEVRALLDYERSHGHRPQYTLLLEQRLSSSA